MNKRTFGLVSLISLLFVLPLSLFAQTTGTTGLPDFTSLGKLITDFNQNVVAAAATLFIALGVTAFFYGIFLFVVASRDADPKKINEGKTFMGWSIAALFVMFSVYGIILFGQNIFGIGGQTDINLPRINLNGSTGSGSTGLPGSGSTGSTGGSVGTGGSTGNNEGQTCNVGSTGVIGTWHNGACTPNECNSAGIGQPCNGGSGVCQSGNAASDYQPYCGSAGNGSSASCTDFCGKPSTISGGNCTDSSECTSLRNECHNNGEEYDPSTGSCTTNGWSQ